MHRYFRFRIFSACILVSCMALVSHADETIDTPEPWDWHIEFQPEDPSDNDYCPFGRARLIGEATHDDDGFPNGEPGGFIEGFAAYGFPEPDINGQNIEVDSYQGAPARANPDRIQIKALTCKSYDRLYLYEVTGHELFHGVEYAYTCGGPFDLFCGIGEGLGDFFVEGHAETMQGKVFDRYEPTPSDDREFYANKAMGTNAAAREQIKHHIQSELRKRVYASTAWWLYLTKEYGYDQTMPGYGADLLHSFWVNAGQLEEPASGFHVLGQTLDDYGVDESLEEIHRRFGVTAMIRDLDFEEGVVPGPRVVPAGKNVVMTGGHGHTFDWSILRSWEPAKPWLLAGGLTTDNVERAIAATGAAAVDVSSGVERERGVKDEVLIHSFIAAAKAA